MSEAPQIVTEGNGWVERTADRAEIIVTYEARGRSRTAAVEDLGKRVARAEPAFGLPGVTVRSRQVWVHTEYRSSKPSGCRASESVGLRIDEVAIVEEVLGLLVGSEPASLSGPTWSLTEPAEVAAEAQRNAVTDARRRAEGYAEALGGRLGPLVRLSEVPEYAAGAPAMAMRARGMTESAPDVSDLGLDPEQVRVFARCTTTWSLISD